MIYFNISVYKYIKKKSLPKDHVDPWFVEETALREYKYKEKFKNLDNTYKPATRLENKLSWSVSRSNILNTCQRKYYYNYYLSWGGWESHTDERAK